MTFPWEWDVAHRPLADWPQLPWPSTSGNLTGAPDRILEEACVLEGHPDNAAACWLGGFVAAANEGRAVRVARVNPPRNWRAIVALPSESLATSKARAVLPATYISADVVANIQAVSMLGLAFAQARGDLLRVAMQDRIHQPYRAEMCPLLPSLLPLAGESGILGVSLSGAGPAVLVIVEKRSRGLGRFRCDPPRDARSVRPEAAHMQF